MAKLSNDERATLLALMARLVDDDGANDDGMVAAIEADAEQATERARIYAAEESARLDSQQSHELAVIDAQADATVRVIEADTAGAAAVAAIDAKAATDVAAVVSAEPFGLDLDAGAAGDDVGDTLDAAAALLSELSPGSDDMPDVPVLDLPTVPAADDLLDDVAPAAQHWWTRERGRKNR